MGVLWSQTNTDINTFNEGLEALFELRQKFGFYSYVYKKSDKIYSPMILLTSEEYTEDDRNNIFIEKYKAACNNLLEKVVNMEKLHITKKVDEYIKDHNLMKHVTEYCISNKDRYNYLVYDPSRSLNLDPNIIHDILYKDSIYIKYYGINVHDLIYISDINIKIKDPCFFCKINDVSSNIKLKN